MVFQKRKRKKRKEKKAYNTAVVSCDLVVRITDTISVQAELERTEIMFGFIRNIIKTEFWGTDKWGSEKKKAANMHHRSCH